MQTTQHTTAIYEVPTLSHPGISIRGGLMEITKLSGSVHVVQRMPISAQANAEWITICDVTMTEAKFDKYLAPYLSFGGTKLVGTK